MTGPTRETLADQVADLIIEHINSAGLGTGEALPAESELARRFGVNRLVVREAVRTLVARGILVSSQGKPAQITTPSSHVFGQLLDFRLRQRSLRFDDLLDTRTVLEVELVRRAAARVSSGYACCGTLYELLTAMTTALDDREEFVSLDVQFHAEIARLADSPVLQLILESLETVLLRSRLASYDGRRRRREDQSGTVVVHRSIADAVAAGAPGEAAARMSAHLSDTRADLQTGGSET